MWRIALGIVVVAGCSQPSRSPKGGDPDRAPDAGVAAAPIDAEPGPAPVTEAECDALIDHLLDLQAKPDHTPEDRAKAHAQIRVEFLPQCLQLDRVGFDCLLAAPDITSFAACGDA